MPISIKKLRENARLPYKATLGSAGYDLCSAEDSDVIIYPGEKKGIGTGIAIALLPDICGMILPRSGLATTKGNITVANSPGLIDSDYRGEIIVWLYNRSQNGSGPQFFVVKPGDRIAQLVLISTVQRDFVVVDELTETARGYGGFGSTGI
jgi:dUTP pyrophosphatase